jgi:hypothetical protein
MLQLFYKFQIYKNNKVIVQPRGRQASKAIIENISIQSHHRFGVQTVGADGHVSELSEIMYEGVEEVASDENSDTESEMDMATVLNVDDYKNGPRRMVNIFPSSKTTILCQIFFLLIKKAGSESKVANSIS